MADKIQLQIKEQIHKAFYDTIKDSIQTRNHGHIIRLYTEIQNRLANMLKKDGNTYQRLLADFDVPFFEQRLRNDAFDGNSMASLVQTTFSWIHNLQMPLRDSATSAAKDRVMASGTTMLEVVPVYIQECHACLDTMEKDMEEFYDNREHPVVREMLRKAVDAKCKTKK